MKKDEIKEHFESLTREVETIKSQLSAVLNVLSVTPYERIQNIQRQCSDTAHKCDDNMKKLREMVNEVRGVVAMIRPNAAKNQWYGQELDIKPPQLEIRMIDTTE